MAGRTLLIITHRLETVRTVDHIVWIEGGKLHASGTPADLMARFPRFASMLGDAKLEPIE